jgi:hypothetical protein
MEENNLIVPEGWTTYSEECVKLVEPGPQTGEDDYHSKYVDPNGKFGAAKVEGGEASSYGG